MIFTSSNYSEIWGSFSSYGSTDIFSRAQFKRLSFLKMAKIGSVILQIQESKRVLEQDTLWQNLLFRNID